MQSYLFFLLLGLIRCPSSSRLGHICIHGWLPRQIGATSYGVRVTLIRTIYRNGYQNGQDVALTLVSEKRET